MRVGIKDEAKICKRDSWQDLLCSGQWKSRVNYLLRETNKKELCF